MHRSRPTYNKQPGEGRDDHSADDPSRDDRGRVGVLALDLASANGFLRHAARRNARPDAQHRSRGDGAGFPADPRPKAASRLRPRCAHRRKRLHAALVRLRSGTTGKIVRYINPGLIAHPCHATGGDVRIKSAPERGTAVEIALTKQVDRQARAASLRAPWRCRCACRTARACRRAPSRHGRRRPRTIVRFS